MGEKRHANAPAAAFPRAARGILARLEALPAGLFAAGCKFSTKRRVAGLAIVGQKGRLLHRRQDAGRAPLLLRTCIRQREPLLVLAGLSAWV